MNNILAAKVLMSHLSEIADCAYKTATEIAIETLFLEATEDWLESNCELSAREYLGLSPDEYARWVIGSRANENE